MLKKILERIVYTRTIKCLHDCNIFSNSRYGYQERHATAHATLILIHKVAKAIDNSSTLLEFSWTSPRPLTLYIMIFFYTKFLVMYLEEGAWERYIIYLANRTQYVFTNGWESCMKEITCCVKQWSLLGPLLFILYTN